MAIAIGAAIAALALVWIGIAGVEAGRLRLGQASTEFGERDRLKQEVRDLFKANDFAGLERLAASYRDGKQRTRSGIWKLTVFYAGFQEVAAELPRDDSNGWRSLTEQVERWRKAYRDEPTVYVANAIILKAHAWSLRPRRLVLEASTGAPNRFLDTLRMAANGLDRAKNIAATDPHFYVVRADLASALAEAPGPFMDLVSEGLDKAPSYYPLYFSGLDFFAEDNAPQRPDIARRIEAFANTAARRLHGADGAAIYARLYWHAYSAIYGNDLFRKSQVDWQRMRGGFEAIVSRYPDAWNRNNFAYLACLYGDRDTTRRLLSDASEPLMLTVWKARKFHDGCQRWANTKPETDRSMQ